MIDPISAAILGGTSLVGGAIAAEGQGSSSSQRVLAPLSTPLYNTRFIGDITNPASTDGAFLNTQLTGLGQGLLSRSLGDFRNIPLSSLTQPGFQYGQSDRDLLGRADTMFDRAGSALDLAATPEASLGFLEQAFGPQLERARAQQESRLLNQGLLGSTAGALQTEGLSRGQQQALMEGALQQQQFQGNLGQGLLGSALNTRQLFSDINLNRVANDLAQRQFLANVRQAGFSNAMGLLGAPERGAQITLGGGAVSNTTPPNPLMQGIGAGIQSIGLGMLGNVPAQTQTVTPQNYFSSVRPQGGGAPPSVRGIGLPYQAPRSVVFGSE